MSVMRDLDSTFLKVAVRRTAQTVRMDIDCNTVVFFALARTWKRAVFERKVRSEREIDE